MKIQFLLIFLLFLFTAGCSTTFLNTTQTIRFIAPSANYAYCLLEADGQKYQFSIPAKITVERSKDDMLLTCQKEGHITATRHIKSKLKSKSENIINKVEYFASSINTISRVFYEYPEIVTVSLVPEN